MIMIGIQRISDRMRTAPTQALRAVFAGIGRILLTADRPDSRAAAAQSRAGGPANGRLARKQQTSQAAARWRDLDKTGNVRLLSAEDMALEFGVEKVGDSVGSPAEPGFLNGADRAAASHGEPALVTMSAAVPTVELPLAGYDDLSLPSIRARLRSLDVSQLRVLLDYERSHAERSDVLGMFERRIDKLDAGG
jgi:hypothetical protein